MPDKINYIAHQWLEKSIDPVPRFLLLRDVLLLLPEDPQLASAEHEALKSRRVGNLISRQLPDGSFGPFKMKIGYDIPNGGENETAMIRALSLGLTPAHPLLRRLQSYLEETLAATLRAGQSRGAPNNMPVARTLILAAMLSELGSEHPLAISTAERWRQILERSFSGAQFDPAVFRDQCDEAFGPSNRDWPGQWPETGVSRYMLMLMRGRLSFPAEKNLLDHLVNRSRGVYPVSNRSLKHFPLEFASRETIRFIAALEQLAHFPAAAPFLTHAADWLWEQFDEPIGWDLGAMAKDDRHLPLSESWRSVHAREADCSVRILILLSRLQQTCDLFDRTCHNL